MDSKHQKSIEKAAREIFDKANAREKAGVDSFEAGWQATLEIMLLMMENHLPEHQGQLLPMQISGQNEWEFHLDVLEKLDLPPDTCAILISPSAFKDMPLPNPTEYEESGLAPWKRNAYSVIISNLRDRTVVLQASLPGIEYSGIDIFEDGKHLADYMYNTFEECVDDLSNVTWTYFSPKGDWNKEQIIRYTENWHAKSIYGLEGRDVRYHLEFSYVNNPELIGTTPIEAVFKVIQSTIPQEYDSLEKSIEMTNDLNQDMDHDEPVVTEAGILQDNHAQCQALMNRIAVEIDMNLEMLSYQKDVKIPDRSIKDSEYNKAFNETARNIYTVITGRDCPESISVI